MSILSTILVRHRFQMFIRTNTERQFVSACLKKFMEENGIDHGMTKPF